MIRRAATGAERRDHGRPRRLADEAILQYQRELALPVRDVPGPAVDRPYALLQGEEGRVDVRALRPSLPVVGLGVVPPLAPSQVDEGELPPQPAGVPVAKVDLAYRVRPRRDVVGLGGVRGAVVVPPLDEG